MKKAPLLIPFLAALPFLIGPWTHALPPRAAEGLLVHYDFHSLEDGRIPDRSGHHPPIHLRVADPRAIRLTPGRLEFLQSTQARSDASATRIADAIRVSGRFTLEAWIQSSDLQQSGPARILTFSSGSSVRNVTLGQDGRRWDVRLRTTRTSDNGIPSTASRPDTVTTNLTHLVFTRDRYGRTRLYLDGQQHSEHTLPGSTVNWDGSYRLALGNELSGDRPWRGPDTLR